MYIFQQFILQLYGVWIYCYKFQMRVSERYRMLFTAEKCLKFCRRDTWKTIHDDDALRYVTWRHVPQTMTS